MKHVAAYQLAFLLALSPLAAPAAFGQQLVTDLFGDEEVGVGDPDGSGEFVAIATPGRERICFQLSVADIAPATAAHIHAAPAGVNGGVVVVLVAPSDGFSSACVSADRELLRDIVRHPEDYYVNVHNADFPGGALRGQIGHGTE